ncbi:MAG: toprim domain-containing protein [Bdellovibrionaceae bacterium]|nr:toprim domain-containing protein [Pseudobdellovibrionaceae bacterium]
MTEERSNRLLEINSFAALHFHKALTSLHYDDPVRLWLTNREIGVEAIDIFKIGFAEPGFSGFPKVLQGQGFTRDIAVECGLIRERRDLPNEYVSVFRRHIMFPIQNEGGHFVGFVGRNLIPSCAPKYLGPIKSPVFGDTAKFYGIHQAKVAIQEAKQVILVEGVLDAIVLYMSGIQNVVSILGTGFTDEQALKLKSTGVEVIAWFDGDEAGWYGLYRLLHMLRNRGIPARGVWNRRLPEPRDYVKTMGPEHTRRRIEKAWPFEKLFNSTLPRTSIIDS